MFHHGIALDVPVTPLERYQDNILVCFVGAKPKAGHDGDGVDCSDQSELPTIQDITRKDL